MPIANLHRARLPAVFLATLWSIATALGVARAAAPPSVDHHQHLLSKAAAESVSAHVLPPVEVPPEIAELLRLRAEYSAKPEALAPLFTEDAMFHGFGPGGWIEGAQKAAEFIQLNLRPGYRLTPVSVRKQGDALQVFGYFTRGEGETLRYPGYFSMTLVQSAGKWKIASEVPVFPGPALQHPVDAAALVGMLDAAGIKRAVVFSNAYFFDGVIPFEGDAKAQVAAENDWTAQQVAAFPDRLIALCSFNPLAGHALAELERCAKRGGFKGLKLHLGTSGVDLTQPEQVEKMRRVMAAANKLHWPVVLHLAASPAYSRRHAEIFIDEILTAAPDVPVVIAHLWGGAGYVDEAMAVYAEAVAAGRPATKRLYFDLAQIAMVEGRSAQNVAKIVARMRQIGMDRMLYGSDGPWGNGMPPRDVWADFLVRLPLTDEEVERIAANVLPGLDDENR